MTFEVTSETFYPLRVLSRGGIVCVAQLAGLSGVFDYRKSLRRRLMRVTNFLTNQNKKTKGAAVAVGQICFCQCKAPLAMNLSIKASRIVCQGDCSSGDAASLVRKESEQPI